MSVVDGDGTAVSAEVCRFRKKPVEIEAVQLCWRNWSAVCGFLGDVVSPENPARPVIEGMSDTCGEAGPEYIELTVTTIHGEPAIVRHGDWIIPEPMPGRFYPCKPDIFAATYDEVAR